MTKNNPKQEFENAENEDEKTKLVYAYYGLAGYWTQCLEQTFENMIIAATFKNKEAISTEFVDAFYDQLSKSKDTMGRLLNKVKNVYSISDAHIAELSQILDLRNYLIHKYFKSNSFKFYSDEGKLEMILGFSAFIERTIKIDKQLQAYYFGYLESFGITEEVLKAAVEAEKKREINKRKKNGG